jgi:hypothetical protein
MSFVSTVKRNRRRKFGRGPGRNPDFHTSNDFRGRAISGELSVYEWGRTGDVGIDLNAHLAADAVVTTMHEKDWNFVAVQVTDGEDSGLPESTTCYTKEQARSLRDSLIALDI